MNQTWYFYGDLQYAGSTYHFVFRLVYTQSNGWRAYIDEAPPYAGRNDGCVSTHRLIDAGQYYICWSSRVNSRENMEAIAQLWAKATVMYIVNGGSGIDSYVTKIQANRA